MTSSSVDDLNARPLSQADLLTLQQTFSQLLPAMHRLLELLENDGGSAETRMAEITVELGRIASSLGASVRVLETLSGAVTKLEKIGTRMDRLEELQRDHLDCLRQLQEDTGMLVDWLGAAEQSRSAAAPSS